MRFSLLLILLVTFSVNVDAQSSEGAASTKEEFAKQYNKNIRKKRINGVYIPANIDEAMVEIVKLSPSDGLKKFANAEESMVVKKLHFGLGKWIAGKWNFYEGSRYSHYLRLLGIADPNDMIQVTLRSLHRHLNDRDINLESQAQLIREKNLKEQEERMKNSKILHSSISPIDTLKKKD